MTILLSARGVLQAETARITVWKRNAPEPPHTRGTCSPSGGNCKGELGVKRNCDKSHPACAVLGVTPTHAQREAVWLS